MAGPNPYRLYSFEELRKVAGTSWLVCDWCQRYAPLAGDLRGKDTRTTTFSCSVCGREAKHVFEDPAKSGRLQFDPRRRPQHHVEAIVRLKLAAERLHRHGDRYAKVPREDLPQRYRHGKPKPEPAPICKLKPFPVRTFADVPAWGLSVAVDCCNCRRRPAPFEPGENLKGASLLGIGLRCTSVIPGNVLAPDRLCGGRGRLRLTPADQRGRVPDAPFIGVTCYDARHTALEANYLVVNKPPWLGQLGREERFACPGCGLEMKHSWHTADTSVQRRW